MPESRSEPMSEGRLPRWRQFDEAWYLLRYPEVAGWMRDDGKEDVQAFYLETGQRYGHSPNRYFDEVWYREAHDEVRRALIAEEFQSGFDHYCQRGHGEYSPHWLFDEGAYLRRYPELTQSRLIEQGLVNGYDHYLEVGEAGYFSAGPLFDEGLCRRLALRHPDYFDDRVGLFACWLTLPSDIADSGRVSWYFDPVWYLERYPVVRQEIAAGRYGSALHHYLTNDTPRAFDPQELFSEQFYAETHQDVVGSLENGAFRNGFAHFLGWGAHEGRAPHQDVDLLAHDRRPQVRRDVRNGLYDSVFAHFVAAKTGEGDRAVLAVTPEMDEAQSRELFRREAEALLPLLARQGLDFTVTGVPEVSVIVVVHDQFALTMQALASLRANYAGAVQLIVVDSGSSDQTRQIERVVRGARVLRFRYNLGYLEGCNAGLAEVEAPFVLYLNNDVRLYPDCLSHALRRLRSDAGIGAVGAKVIRTNMRLQEAGSIVWRDGATYGYRREDSPNLPEANFVRDVDYASAVFLMARASVLRRAEGYDARYRPAYFEDADLCVRIIKAGSRIVYDPNVVVEHLEFGSSGEAGSHALMRANMKVFARTHSDFLRLQQPAHIRNAVHARERRSERKHILFVEDRLPLRRLGSGYVRSNDVVREMAALGYQVTVFPMLPRDQSETELFGDFPETVELIADQHFATFPDFLQERAGYYDLLWVGRTHNMVRLLPVLNEASRYLPSGGAILDTEVIATPRTLGRVEVLGLPKPASDFDEMLRLELECAHYCQRIVAVTAHDAGLVRRAGYDNVSVLGHEMPVRPTPSVFDARRDILFLGALHDEGAPNHDSLEWFVGEVLPLLDDVLPADVRFTIAGFISPTVDMSVFARHPRVDIAGAVQDLAPLFDRHRVFVAPTRFAGGLPFKVQEAAALGVPMVVTSLLAEQVGWTDGEELLSASAGDARQFADQVARLYRERDLWERVRGGALDAVARDCAPMRFRQDLAGILQSCLV